MNKGNKRKHKKNESDEELEKEINDLNKQEKKSNSKLNDIEKRKKSNLLITNLLDKNDIKEELKKSPEIVGFINFLDNQFYELPDFDENDLYINKDTNYLELIKYVYDKSELELLNDFKNMSLKPPDKKFVYLANGTMKTTLQMMQCFKMKNTIQNRNKINKMKFNTFFDEELETKYNNEYRIAHILQYVSIFFVKRYLFFFYNHRKENIEPEKQLYIYDYVLACILEKDERKLEEIIEEANYSYYNEPDNEKTKDGLNREREVILKIFNNENPKFKKTIDEIKNYFKKDNEIFLYVSPQYIFIYDLLRLGHSFDFLPVYKMYEKLSDKTKIRYEIKLYKNFLINEFKKYVKKDLKKEKKIKNKIRNKIRRKKIESDDEDNSSEVEAEINENYETVSLDQSLNDTVINKKNEKVKTKTKNNNKNNTKSQSKSKSKSKDNKKRNKSNNDKNNKKRNKSNKGEGNKKRNKSVKADKK